MEQQKQRVIVYIDGFNFYFGLKHNAKWKKYYWLDVVKLFESFMRPNQELVAVKYFSAKPDDIQPGVHREVCIDKMEFNADGTIKRVVPTHSGVELKK